MAQKGKRKPVKTDSGVEKKVVAEKTAPPKSGQRVSTLEEATKVVEEGYKTSAVLEYVVLEDGQVFFGNKRPAALKYARKFDLNYFDVKF